MQKLIKNLKTKQQITALTLALEPGFLDLIKDVNGNHVLQCCLKCLGHNYNKVSVCSTDQLQNMFVALHHCMSLEVNAMYIT